MFFSVKVQFLYCVVATCLSVGLSALRKDLTKGALVGDLKQLQHEVAGRVWAVDENTLHIEKFTYDGIGPDAFFWMGNETQQPSPKGFIIHYPPSSRKTPVLPRFRGEDLILRLPTGKKITDMKWFSVWCRRFTVDFGHVLVPKGLDPPKKLQLPEFSRVAHGVRSGNVTVLDAKTFYIPNLHYDGAGPDAFFWVGKGTEPDHLGQKVPNELGDYSVLGAYDGVDIEIQLPGNLTIYDIDYLSIWCVAYKHNFGHVLIPHANSLWVPPALGQTPIKPYVIVPTDKDKYLPTHKDKPQVLTSPELTNCRQLSDDVMVEWQVFDEDLQVRLTARMDDDQYIAFGLSPEESRPEMLNSDIVVAYYDRMDGSYHAVDYTVTARSECANLLGVCPDEAVNGRNDASIIEGSRRDGVTSVHFSRPLNTNDRLDIPVRSHPHKATVIAAIGRLNNKKEANYHHKFVTKDLIQIDFSSSGEKSCPTFVQKQPKRKFDPWQRRFIHGVTNFTATIGPTGGDRGYRAVSNATSWGIAWWMNDLLIPEIYVERGNTYYFTVQGGNNDNNPSIYHPLYITDSLSGGLGQKSLEEQHRERIFAGVAYTKMGMPYPTAYGPLCQWKHSWGSDSWEDSLTFEEYRETLYKECESGPEGSLVWTVTEDTPDVVYYQCYTHQYLGWKVFVTDPGYNLPQNTAHSLYPSLNVLSVAIASIVFLFAVRR